MTRRTRKCGYARVSTLAEEQEHSLSFQTHYYKTLIESERDSEFVGIYADTRSGKTARLRRQFNEMIKAARRGEIDYIYTKSIARFARNLVETLQIVRELRAIGVGVIFEKEGIDTLNSSSDFLLSIYATVAESELASMGDNVKWAARKRYKNGSVELAYIYGYKRLEDGSLVIEPEEAAIVREIFERYLGGEGSGKIARSLADRGVKRKFSDERWRHCTIKGMLRNEKYCGDALLQKMIYENGVARRNNGEVPQYYVENNHEPIISREDFNKVQELMEQRAAAYTTYKSKTLSPFSGKIVCAECGKSYLHRKNNRNTPYEKWIWSCQTYVQQGRKHCSGHNIREKDLQALFLSAYNEAAKYESQDDPAVSLAESIKILLAQERELVALKVKGYITREAHDEQHAELLKQIKDTEAALLLATRHSGSRKYDAAEEYEDSLVGSLDTVEVDDYTLTFKFKNGAEIKRTFNNDVNRKETWNKKLGRAF